MGLYFMGVYLMSLYLVGVHFTGRVQYWHDRDLTGPFFRSWPCTFLRSQYFGPPKKGLERARSEYAKNSERNISSDWINFGVAFGFCLGPRHGPPVMVMPVLARPPPPPTGSSNDPRTLTKLNAYAYPSLSAFDGDLKTSSPCILLKQPCEPPLRIEGRWKGMLN
jgi:hypothetical protein